MVKASATIAAFSPVMVQQAWRAGAPGPCDCSPSPGSAAAVSGSALSICKALLMCRDASPSRVLVAGKTVYWGGGDASGKRSESDGYSGWAARARTSGSALAFYKAGRWKASPRSCQVGPQATSARSVKVP